MITEFVPPKTRELNRQAFLLGRNWVEKAIQEPGLPSEENTEKVFSTPRQTRIELEITESWCKGCDICVKMCPERCLRLNEGLVAELSDPEACTGCRVCELLCPDFAIKLTFILLRETVEMSGSFSLQSLQGNHACALGAIQAGCRFYAGYPITPSSEIAERMALELPKVEGYFIQMEDELASMGAILGASMGGTKAMTATSGPGFSLKQENLGYASAVEIPCVVVNVMRGGPSTGMPTRPAQADLMQARWGSHGDHPVIVLAPDSVQEIHQQTIRAFDLAEQFRVPVVVISMKHWAIFGKPSIFPRPKKNKG